MRFYKVVEVKQRSMIKGQMSSLSLQNIINEWATQGWDFDKIVAGETAVLMGIGAKDVFLLIFKKSFDFPNDIFMVVDGIQSQFPISEIDFRTLAQAHRIGANSLACKKGMSEWKALHEISPELADALTFFWFNQ